ncbi:MAG: hypothetical protein RR066_04845 [Mucinivorans sp.]
MKTDVTTNLPAEQVYQAPTVEVVELKAEHGIAASAVTTERMEEESNNVW